MLITKKYREQLEQMHANKEHFGKRSSIWAPAVYGLCMGLDTLDVLDYGCGKAELNLHMPFGVHGYDPGVPKYAGNPEPADIVVCTDVLEHIEPTFLDDVLAHLHSKTRKVALVHIHCREAAKHLPDGRNAHLIVQPPDWWLTKLTVSGPWALRDAPEYMFRKTDDDKGFVDRNGEVVKDKKALSSADAIAVTVLLTP